MHPALDLFLSFLLPPLVAPQQHCEGCEDIGDFGSVDMHVLPDGGVYSVWIQNQGFTDNCESKKLCSSAVCTYDVIVTAHYVPGIGGYGSEHVEIGSNYANSNDTHYSSGNLSDLEGSAAYEIYPSQGEDPTITQRCDSSEVWTIKTVIGQVEAVPDSEATLACSRCESHP